MRPVTQSADEQIADTAIVTVDPTGLWNLASGNHSETVLEGFSLTQVRFQRVMGS